MTTSFRPDCEVESVVVNDAVVIDVRYETSFIPGVLEGTAVTPLIGVEVVMTVLTLVVDELENPPPGGVALASPEMDQTKLSSIWNFIDFGLLP